MAFWNWGKKSTNNISPVSSQAFEEPTQGSGFTYKECKRIYLEWALGKRIVEALPRFAMSSPRKIVIQDAPPEVVERFEKTLAEYKVNQIVKRTAYLSRVYGLAGIYVATDLEDDKRENLTKSEAMENRIFFNVLDPMNMTGIQIDQNPLSPRFQRISNATVNGAKVGYSRLFTLQCGIPMFIDFTQSTFNFASKSIFHNMQELVTLWGDLYLSLSRISLKASSILITGSGGGATTGIATEIKQQSANFVGNLREDGVAFMPEGYDANFFNLNGISEIKAILDEIRASLAMAVNDTPTAILLDKDLANGLSDGSEDMKAVIMAVNDYRENHLNAIYDFLDSWLFYKAWDDDFVREIKAKYAKEYGLLGEVEIREKWIKDYSYEWENIYPPTTDEETKRKMNLIDMLLKAKDLGATLADIEAELNESKVFVNEMTLEEQIIEPTQEEEIFV